MDPLKITSGLKIQRDTQNRRGEQKLGRNRRTGKVSQYAPHKFGMWSFSSKPWVQSPRLEVHLGWFFDQLEAHAATLRELQRRYKMDFFCFASGRSSRPPTVAKSVRSRAEALGVPIEIDYYPLAATERATE